jgi:hypothetical protein
VQKKPSVLRLIPAELYPSTTGPSDNPKRYRIIGPITAFKQECS